MKRRAFSIANDGSWCKISKSRTYGQESGVTHCFSFMENWIIPTPVLTDNGMLTVSGSFEVPCPYLGTTHLMPTTYHLQTKRQEKRLDRTFHARLQHRLAEHFRVWDVYVQPVKYAYTVQFHRFTNLTPSSLVLLRFPPGLILFYSTTAFQASPTVTTSSHIL